MTSATTMTKTASNPSECWGTSSDGTTSAGVARLDGSRRKRREHAASPATQRLRSAAAPPGRSPFGSALAAAPRSISAAARMAMPALDSSISVPGEVRERELEEPRREDWTGRDARAFPRGGEGTRPARASLKF
jgi:hypothetical protein